MRNGSKTFTPPPPNGWAKDSCLSERILLGLGKAFSFVLYVLVRFVMRYRFTVLRKNLETSFPHKPEAEIRALITTYYRHLADLVVEPVLFTVAGRATRKKLATYANMDLLNHLYHEKKHAILLASHIGNWEYLINLPRETELRGLHRIYTHFQPAYRQLGAQDAFQVRCDGNPEKELLQKSAIRTERGWKSRARGRDRGSAACAG
jgi:hypothetical protein